MEISITNARIRYIESNISFQFILSYILQESEYLQHLIVHQLVFRQNLYFLILLFKAQKHEALKIDDRKKAQKDKNLFTISHFFSYCRFQYLRLYCEFPLYAGNFAKKHGKLCATVVLNESLDVSNNKCVQVKIINNLQQL